MSRAHALPCAAPPYGQPAPALLLLPAVPLDFDEAVTRLRPRLRRYAGRRLGNAQEAEELVQEALLRAYTHRERLLTEDDLAAWTTVVTGRLVIDRLRVRGRSTSVADVPEGARVGRDTADIVVARDEARTALDALGAMPIRQSALLWAREVEGRSYDELCKRFAMTEPAVRSVLTRARKALRKEYARRGGTLPVGAVVAPCLAALGLAGRLCRVAARATAPTAALGAVGVTALGGLLLTPQRVPPSQVRATSHPAPAVGRSAGGRGGHAAAATRLGPLTSPAVAPARTAAVPAPVSSLVTSFVAIPATTPRSSPVLEALDAVCALHAGSPNCQDTATGQVALGIPLPEGLTGSLRRLAAQQSLVTCSRTLPRHDGC